jgi:tetratricopeptide (TPR) repeat protein
MLSGAGFWASGQAAAPPAKFTPAAAKSTAAKTTKTSAPAGKSSTAGASPSIKANVANLLAQGDAAYVAGNLDEAEKQFQAALTAAESSKDQRGAVAALDKLASCRAGQKDLIGEEKLREKAVATAAEAFGANSAQTAMQMSQQAGFLARRGAIGEAREMLDKAKAMLNKDAGDHPVEDAVYSFNEGTLQSAQNLGGLAEDSLKHACALLASQSGARVHYARALEAQATVLEQLERTEDAKAVQEKLTLLRGTSIAGSTTSGTSSAVAIKLGADPFFDYVRVAISTSMKQDRDAAITNWKLSLKEAEKTSNSDGRVAYVLIHLGDEYSRQKLTGDAEAMYKRSLELREKSNATGTLGMARNLGRLATMSGIRGDFKQADALLTRALRIEEQCNADDSIVAATLSAMASPCAMLKLNDKSEACYKRLLEIADRGKVANAAVLKTMASGMLGGLYMSTGRLEQGMNLIKKVQGAAQQSPDAIAKSSLQEFIKVETLIDEAEQKALGFSIGATASH